jgi:hypothetical protein
MKVMNAIKQVESKVALLDRKWQMKEDSQLEKSNVDKSKQLKESKIEDQTK